MQPYKGKKKRVKTPSMSLSPEAFPSSYSPTGDFLCLWRTDLGAAGLSGPLSSCLRCQRDQQRKSLMKAVYPDVHLSEVREDTGKLPDAPSKKTSLPASASFRLCTQKFPHPCCFHCHCFWKKEHCLSLPGSLHTH